MLSVSLFTAVWLGSAAALPSQPAGPKVLEDPNQLEPFRVPEGYRNLQNITDVLRSWEAAHPDRARVYDITDEFNNGRKTAEGRGEAREARTTAPPPAPRRPRTAAQRRALASAPRPPQLSSLFSSPFD